MAVTHLIEAGHRRIGMIAATPESEIQNRGIGGCRDALEQAELPFDPRLVATGRTEKHAGYSEEAGYEAMLDLLALDELVTAVLAGSDV